MSEGGSEKQGGWRGGESSLVMCGQNVLQYCTVKNYAVVGGCVYHCQSCIIEINAYRNA